MRELAGGIPENAAVAVVGIYEKGKKGMNLFKGAVADKALKNHSKILAAIEAERWRLIDVTKARLAAERALVAAETAAALGEPTDRDVARKRLDSDLAETARISSILGGLRARLAAGADDIERRHEEVRSSIAGHAEIIRREFAAKWERLTAEYGQLMGERAEVERITGEKLALGEPQRHACELSAETLMPWHTTEALRVALDQIAALGRALTAARVDQMRPGAKWFDPSAVYVVTNDAAGLPSGTTVTGAVFMDGEGAHLASIDYITPACTEDLEKYASRAANAIQRIVTDEIHERANSDASVYFNPISEAELERAQRAERSCGG